MMRTLLCFCLLLCADPIWAQQGTENRNKDEKRGKPTYNFALTASHYGDFRVSNVPQAVRAVPLHRDDGHLAGNPFATQPIVNDDLGTFTIATLGLEARGEYRWLEIGGRFSYTGTFGDRVRQNQFGTGERGSGTSLRFYEVSSKYPVTMILFGGLRIPLARARGDWQGIRLAVGGEFDPLGTTLQFRAGWDRFNKDETWRRFDIGRLRRDGLYARLDVSLGDGAAWVSLQANLDQPRVSLRPGFRDVRIESRGIPLTLSLRFTE